MGNTPQHKRREASYVEFLRTPLRETHWRKDRRRTPSAASAGTRPRVMTKLVKMPQLLDATPHHQDIAQDLQDTAPDEGEIEQDLQDTVPEEGMAAMLADIEAGRNARGHRPDDARFLLMCRHYAPVCDEGRVVRVAAVAEQFHRRAGRRGTGDRRVDTRAWLVLAASFLGEDDAFIRDLHRGSPETRSALKRACLMGLNLIGGSSVCV